MRASHTFPPRPSAAWEARQWAKKNRAALNAAWEALPDVPRTIEQHIKGKAA